ncbi:MAG: alanine--glyoxylate aminotransferase family protein [Betaproteobacteria bacterium]|jgi:aspartate aminotransferase-like enzyme|uniref:Aminotransferase class V n=1 Tax=Thiomonas delicata TaxID=364030 RepID=A0A238D059_THIDL|nr:MULTISPECIES: aminotransferase class V-fold PLP-dependent enzyme [Thiomonas]MDE2129660.1 alanine--glyoxylate aminotransferase family protein [Betaproteobacteria bacterium]OZB43474.1 MAG: class V aminotransferase [Thiomonas sp. 15-66-11]OZB59869.1 MAG: class V aminotransferase [Thiomonas sp. 13-66-29]SBP86643.1 Aminotransferase class V [Thiomonas delicata]
MPGLLPHVDPDGLLEYSVVYTDRALNHMARRFQGVMTDIAAMLKQAYGADAAVIVPGSGTFAMEAVARQFVPGGRVLVIRNGWFSFRWSQIIETGKLSDQITVLKARRTADAPESPFAPAPIDEVVAAIRRERPAVVFAPHVETSAGMMLPDDYLRAVGEAVRAVDGLFVLDCIASGAMWVDMRDVGVDVLVSAPQKGWSGPPCAGFAMLGERAVQRLQSTQSDSYSCDLKKWHQIMQAYEGGGHAYHATMPTDALAQVRDVMREAFDVGLPKLKAAQIELGRAVRESLQRRGLRSVAAPGFQAPGVVVSYTRDPDLQSGKALAAQGLQIAAGVPLACDEPADFRSFRIGLFGLDKWADVPACVRRLDAALDAAGLRAVATTQAQLA